MNSGSRFTLRIALLSFFFGWLSAEATSQTGTYELSGKRYEYVMVFPMPGTWSTEKPRGNPLRIQLTSDRPGVVNIVGPGVNQTVSVLANKTKEVSFQPTGKVLVTTSQSTDQAFRITSTIPLRVAGYMTWAGTGELFTIPEVSELGTEYYTLNLWEDWIGRKPDLFSGFIAIVSNADNNVVTIEPKCKLLGQSVKKSVTVTLNKYQCYLVKADTSLMYIQQKQTDLTGTHISSTKPILVISGHEKCAAPQYPAVIAGEDGTHMRNCLVEVMPPASQWGTQFVVAPYAYTNRTRKIWPNDDGDLFRVVATEDGTQVYRTDINGSAYPIGGILKAGEFYELNESETVKATILTSNKPVVVGQYAKGWLEQYFVNSSEKGDKPEAQPLIIKGNPSLQTVLPTNKWTSFARFSGDPDLDNWIYLVYRTKDESAITFDGIGIRTVFGAKIKQVAGSEFSYVMQMIAPSDHVVASSESTSFWATSYGNLDGLQEAIAYASTANMAGLERDCFDTIAVSEKVDCNSLVVTAVRTSTTTCSVERITATVFSNHSDLVAKVDTSSAETRVLFSTDTANFWKNFTGTIEFCNGVDECVNVPFQFKPFSNDGFETKSLEKLSAGTTQTFALKVVNSNSFTVTVTSFGHTLVDYTLHLKNTLPFTLKPGESKSVTFEFTVPDVGSYSDSIYFLTDCGGEFSHLLIFESQIPIGVNGGHDPIRDISVKYNNGNISVALGNGEQIESIDLFDIMGRKIEMKNNFNREATLTANGLSEGAYYVRITTKKWVVSVPVMVRE